MSQRIYKFIKIRRERAAARRGAALPRGRGARVPRGRGALPARGGGALRGDPPHHRGRRGLGRAQRGAARPDGSLSNFIKIDGYPLPRQFISCFMLLRDVDASIAFSKVDTSSTAAFQHDLRRCNAHIQPLHS